MIPTPLAAMGRYRQFMLYKIIDGMKYPYDWETNNIVSAHESKYWMDYDTANNMAMVWGKGYGVAFVFTESDPFWFIDIDHCYENGVWSSLALEICGLFAGAAVEISVSGTGIHIFGSYSGEMPPHGCKPKGVGIEFYHTGRFVALTGTGIIGDSGVVFDMSNFITKYVPNTGAGAEGGWTEEPCEGYGNGLDTDDLLLDKALSSKGAGAAFGTRCSFADLWLRDVDALHKFYPDKYKDRDFDDSDADSALAMHLAFWTGKNCERIERLMLMSGLVRDKWFKHKTYLQRTILNAVRRCGEVYSVNKFEDLQIEVDSDGKVTFLGNNPFVSVDRQLELFKGCAYVLDAHKIMIPGGRFLSPETFKVYYGGKKWVIDTGNTKIVDDAWQAYTQNQVYKFPQVESQAFKPSIPCGAIFEHGGTSFVNNYFPQAVKRAKGDVSPMLRHLEKILPVERDRTIFLSYMAACVQHAGTKFQWAPLLQGVEGNGKTLFTRCVAEAVGNKYTHWCKASKLGKEFNAWMLNKLFYAVEDVYCAKSKFEIWEDLKPMITGGNGLEIEGKGVDQISADICGNFMFNSNHKDGLPKTNNDRRLCVLFTAQQSASDLTRDGMGGSYFVDLYNWYNTEGIAYVNEFLYTYAIPDEFNPAKGCHRAPFTSSTGNAIYASLSALDQDIEEAAMMDRVGFIGGWLSSVMLDRLIAEKGHKRLSISMKHKIVENLGYVLHPALHNGITPSIVMPDGAKTKLYVKNNSPYVGLTSSAEVMECYSRFNS